MNCNLLLNSTCAFLFAVNICIILKKYLLKNFFQIFQWDIRSGEVVQEYDRHLGAVNTITFVDGNRRFVTTSDDKSLRVWEWYV